MSPRRKYRRRAWAVGFNKSTRLGRATKQLVHRYCAKSCRVLSEQGGPIHPRNFDRVWYGLMDTTKVRRIRFYDLRHMHVSLLNKAGVDARTIADRIGHTDPAFTIRRYAHVFEDQRRAAISLLELLSPRQAKSN